jgi:hypothetical protein
MSDMHKHAQHCWGEEIIVMTDRVKNANEVCNTTIDTRQKILFVVYKYIDNRVILMHTRGAPNFPHTPPKYSNNVCYSYGLNTNQIAF